MPNKDGTGPEGKGPKTGRQMGNCRGVKPTSKRGRGLGHCRRGLGRERGFDEQNLEKEE